MQHTFSGPRAVCVRVNALVPACLFYLVHCLPLSPFSVWLIVRRLSRSCAVRSAHVCVCVCVCVCVRVRVCALAYLCVYRFKHIVSTLTGGLPLRR